jgi:hypothetical protein
MPKPNFGFVPFSAGPRPRASLPQHLVDQHVQSWLDAGNRVTICPPASVHLGTRDILENLDRMMPPEPRGTDQPRANAPLFTPERDAMLRRMWLSGAAAEDIQVALNQMDGPCLTVEAVRSRASSLKLLRPRGYPKGIHARRRAKDRPMAEAADEGVGQIVGQVLRRSRQLSISKGLLLPRT